MRKLGFVMLVALLGAGAPGAAAQQRGDDHLSRDERHQLRQDLNDARREQYRRGNPQREPRAERRERMSPAERDKLRRDINDANRDLRRRR